MVGLTVCWFRTSRTHVSRHTGLMSHDIRDTAPASGHVEGTSGHHRRHHREAIRRRGRLELRRVPLLDLRTPGPLPSRGRRRVRTPVPGARRPHRAQPRTRPSSWSCGSARNSSRPATTPARTPLVWHLAQHHQHHRVASHHAPDPDPPRRDHPGAEEAPEVVLHPLPGRDAQRVPGSPTSPTTRSPTPPRSPRASRSSPGSTTAPATPSTCPRTGPITTPIVTDHLPRNRRSARHPRIDPHRQRHGLHRPPGRHRPPRRTQRLRATAPRPGTWPRRTPDPTTPPPAARSNASSRR